MLPTLTVYENQINRFSQSRNQMADDIDLKRRLVFVVDPLPHSRHIVLQTPNQYKVWGNGRFFLAQKSPNVDSGIDFTAPISTC